MSTTTRASVLAEVSDEREHQDRQWGGPSHDDQHQIADFAEFVKHQLSRMTGQDCRARYIKIAALAVAAVESIDRKTPHSFAKPSAPGVYETRIPGARGWLLRRWTGRYWLTNHATERDEEAGTVSGYQDYEWVMPHG